MATLFKYIGAFCLLTIAASMAFCSMGVYNGVKTVNRVIAGADNYTCRQFTYDMTQPDTDKLPALTIATIAYGSGGEGDEVDTKQDELVKGGVYPAVAKVNALCKGQPDERILNLFAATVVGSVSKTLPTATISATTVSTTTPQTVQ